MKHSYATFLKENGVMNPQGAYRKTTEQYLCEKCGKAWIDKKQRKAHTYGPICPDCGSIDVSTSREREPPLIIAFKDDIFLGDWKNGETK